MNELYRDECYLHKERWNAFWRQFQLIKSLHVDDMLEIGVGSGILRLMAERAGIRYESVDIEKDFFPTYTGDFRTVNINKTFDLVAAFEVLEHLEFQEFRPSLERIHSLTKKYCIISLPYWGPYLQISFKIYPVIKLDFVKKIWLPKRKNPSGIHKWEIGRNGFPLRRIRKELLNIWGIIEEGLMKEYPYHYYFILVKK